MEPGLCLRILTKDDFFNRSLPILKIAPGQVPACRHFPGNANITLLLIVEDPDCLRGLHKTIPGRCVRAFVGGKPNVLALIVEMKDTTHIDTLMNKACPGRQVINSLLHQNPSAFFQRT